MSAEVRVRVTLPLGVSQPAEIVTFRGLPDAAEHVAVAFGKIAPWPLVRIHSECLTGDVLGSFRCDCGPQLDQAIALLGRDGGILLYMRQEGRGIGLYNKLDAYALQDAGLDTFAANRHLGYGSDERSYETCVRMLEVLGVNTCRLLTNNPLKIHELEKRGIRVEEVIPTGYFRTRENAAYLDAKESLSGHLFKREVAAGLLDEVRGGSSRG